MPPRKRTSSSAARAQTVLDEQSIDDEEEAHDEESSPNDDFFLPEDDADDESREARELENIRYNNLVFRRTCDMLRMRGTYEVLDYTEAAEQFRDNPAAFKDFIMNPAQHNPLRDAIVSIYAKQQLPPFRINMSMLVRARPSQEDAPAKYAAILFAERKDKQVSKKLFDVFLKAIALIKSKGIYVVEMIAVSPVQPGSGVDTFFRTVASGCTSQIFIDDEILAPPFYSLLQSRFRRIDAARFFSENPYLTRHKMQQINHEDISMRYMGVPAGTVVEVLRPNLVSNNMRQTELTFAYVY